MNIDRIVSGNILEKLVEKYPEKPWDWEYLSINPNITAEFIEKHINMPWNKFRVFEKPNITLDFMERNIHKIDFHKVSRNSFKSKRFHHIIQFL